MDEEMYSISYTSLASGGLSFVVATVEQGQVFAMELSREEAVTNLLAFARTLGLAVSQPL